MLHFKNIINFFCNVLLGQPRKLLINVKVSSKKLFRGRLLTVEFDPVFCIVMNSISKFFVHSYLKVITKYDKLCQSIDTLN
jgi:hypothetical protein